MNMVSTMEIADILGVTRQRVSQLAATDGFPPPAADLAIGRVWWRDDITRWAVETGRINPEEVTL